MRELRHRPPGCRARSRTRGCEHRSRQHIHRAVAWQRRPASRPGRARVPVTQGEQVEVVGRVDEAGAGRRAPDEPPPDRQVDSPGDEDRDGGDRDAEPEGEPLDGRHLAAAGLGQRVGRAGRLVERCRHVVADERHTPQVVARVRQRPRQARRRLGRLPSGRGQGHRGVVDLVPDPDPQHQPEHEQQVGDDLGGPAAGGVGIELHGPIGPGDGRVGVLSADRVLTRTPPRPGASRLLSCLRPRTRTPRTPVPSTCRRSSPSALLSSPSWWPSTTSRPTRGSRRSSPSSICYLVTSSFTLAKVIRDRQEDEMVFSRLDQARLEKALATHDPYKGAPRPS